MKHSYQSILTAISAFAASGAICFSSLPAQAENQSSEMRDLVQKAQGLKPSDSDAEKKKIDSPRHSDPAAIYLQAGVDAAQADKIRELRKNLEKVNQLKVTEAYGLYKEMHDLTVQAELNEAKILETQGKINTLHGDMAMEKTKTLIAIRKILTPKQRENLAEIIRKRTSAKAESAH